MIKSTHPEFEKLILGEPVNSTLELLGFLDGIGVPYSKEGSALTLNPGLDLLDEATIRAELQHWVSGYQMSTLALEIHRVTQSTNDVVMQRLVESQSTDNSMRRRDADCGQRQARQEVGLAVW